MLENVLKNRTVCVFCGAGGKMSQELKQLAFMVGQELAANGFHLLTGGANVGMMKEVVDGHAAISADLIRYGVLPKMFENFEIKHDLIADDKMLWSGDIHNRLKHFHEISDDIVVLPGGFGTLHELMDCMVHSQYGFIKKRIYLVNTNNFWNPLLEQFKLMIKERAVEQKHVDHLIVVENVLELLESLKSELEFELVQGVEAERWEVEN